MGQRNFEFWDQVIGALEMERDSILHSSGEGTESSEDPEDSSSSSPPLSIYRGLCEYFDGVEKQYELQLPVDVFHYRYRLLGARTGGDLIRALETTVSLLRTLDAQLEHHAFNTPTQLLLEGSRYCELCVPYTLYVNNFLGLPSLHLI